MDSYCLFMDILGYSQAVKKSVENGNAREEFGNFYKAIYRLKDSLSGKDNAVMLTKGAR